MEVEQQRFAPHAHVWVSGVDDVWVEAKVVQQEGDSVVVRVGADKKAETVSLYFFHHVPVGCRRRVSREGSCGRQNGRRQEGRDSKSIHFSLLKFITKVM